MNQRTHQHQPLPIGLTSREYSIDLDSPLGASISAPKCHRSQGTKGATIIRSVSQPDLPSKSACNSNGPERRLRLSKVSRRSFSFERIPANDGGKQMRPGGCGKLTWTCLSEAAQIVSARRFVLPRHEVHMRVAAELSSSGQS